MFGLIKRIVMLAPALVGLAVGAAIIVWGFYGVETFCGDGEYADWYQWALFGGGAFVGLGGLFAVFSALFGSGDRVFGSVLPPIFAAGLIIAIPYALAQPALSLAVGGAKVCADGNQR